MCTPGQVPQEARGFRSPGAGVAVACCGCWEPNSLQEQQFRPKPSVTGLLSLQQTLIGLSKGQA